MTPQAPTAARTANGAGWRGCGCDWVMAAAGRRRGTGPIQCTKPPAPMEDALRTCMEQGAASGSKNCRGWPGSARGRECRCEGSRCYRGLPGWGASRVWGGGTAGEVESQTVLCEPEIDDTSGPGRSAVGGGGLLSQATHRALSRQPDLGSPRTLWSNAAGHRLHGHITLPPSPPAVPLSNHCRHRSDSMEIAPRAEGERAASAPGLGHAHIQWSG